MQTIATVVYSKEDFIRQNILGGPEKVLHWLGSAQYTMFLVSLFG